MRRFELVFGRLVAVAASAILAWEAGAEPLAAEPAKWPVHFAQKGACLPSGFCWEHPLPQGVSLYGVWAAAQNDAWTVGCGGTLLHWDGTSWSQRESGTQECLRAVWGSSAKDFWFGGDNGALFHSIDGKIVARPQHFRNGITAVWGSAPDDVWMAARHTILQSNGDAIYENAPGIEQPMFGGDDTQEITAIWGVGPEHIWTGGPNHPTAIYDGDKWTKRKSPSSLLKLWGHGATLWGLDSHFGVRTLVRLQGKGWVAAAPPLTWPLALAGSAKEVWLVGDRGRMSRFAGGTFEELASPVGVALQAAWSAGPGKLIAVGKGGTALVFTGSSFEGVSRILTDQLIFDFFGASERDLWAVGRFGLILHYDGTAWQLMPSPTSGNLQGVWGSAPDQIFAVGADGVLRWDGRTWSPTAAAAGRGLNAVWGSGPADVWVGGFDGLQHFDGQRWAPPVKPWRSYVNGIWGSGPADVWAVGGSVSSVLHFDGQTWSEVPLPKDVHAPFFERISGSSPADVWVAGADEMLHFDGKRWSGMPSGTRTALHAIYANRPDDAWAVGAGGTVVHYDGKRWSEVISRLGIDLHAVFGFKDRAVFIAGDNGAILRRQSAPVTSRAAPPAPLGPSTPPASSAPALPPPAR